MESVSQYLWTKHKKTTYFHYTAIELPSSIVGLTLIIVMIITMFFISTVFAITFFANLSSAYFSHSAFIQILCQISNLGKFVFI